MLALKQASGVLFLSQYPKASSHHLMVFWGGRPEDVFLPSKVHVFLTRAGIPRIIPSFQKKKIKFFVGVEGSSLA
jgi:hypothetical protein